MIQEANNMQAKTESTPARVRELTEQELLAVAGGARSESHVHMSCCNDCPTREPG